MPKQGDKSGKQQDAEADVKGFSDDLGPFVVATETTRMAMVFADAKEDGHPIIFANDSFLSLTGYARDEVLGAPFNFLLAHAADPDDLAKVEAEFQESSAGQTELLYRRKDGSEFWAELFVSPVRDDGGDIVQYFGSIVDLTRHKEAQAHSEMLIGELNHRVKNTLATVQSVVWQALRTSTDPKSIREAIGTRLSALSRSHDLLTQESWRSADLRAVISAAIEPYQALDGLAARIVMAGQEVRLPPKATLALGIAFNELATNAVKYGALANGEGSVRVEWTVEPSPETIVLAWRETDGPPVTPPATRGFGSLVIERGLAHELKGAVNLDYRPDGLVCTMRIPTRSARGE